MIHDPDGNYVPADPVRMETAAPPPAPAPVPVPTAVPSTAPPAVFGWIGVLVAAMLASVGIWHGVLYAVDHVRPVVGIPGRVSHLEVEVTALQKPKPGPTPRPSPSPAPAPIPVVTSYAGPLWAVAVLPDPPTTALAALQSSTSIRTALDADGLAYWHTYLAGQNAVSTPAWKARIAKVGPPPVVLWMDAQGGLLKTTPSPTEASVLSDLKAVRGR